MFWRRRQFNARNRHEYVLDVKLHQQQARAGAVRFAGKASLYLFGAAVVLLCIWQVGALVLDRLIYRNPTFALQTIDVRSDGALLPEAVLRWAGVKPGENLMALDLRRIKRDLELQPFVESVAIERVLPSTLRLRVTEREPVAVIYEVRPRPGGAGFDTLPLFLDRGGHVFPVPARQITVESQFTLVGQLPVLTGAAGIELRIGLPVFAPKVQSALRLLSLFDESEMASATDIRQMDLSAPEILLVTTGQGSRVTFATSLSPDMQLRRWRTIHELGLRNNKAIATLDLSITNHLPALWVEAGQAPAATPKSSKPIRTKKKNV